VGDSDKSRLICCVCGRLYGKQHIRWVVFHKVVQRHYSGEVGTPKIVEIDSVFTELFKIQKGMTFFIYDLGRIYSFWVGWVLQQSDIKLDGNVGATRDLVVAWSTRQQQSVGCVFHVFDCNQSVALQLTSRLMTHDVNSAFTHWRQCACVHFRAAISEGCGRWVAGYCC